MGYHGKLQPTHMGHQMPSEPTQETPTLFTERLILRLPAVEEADAMAAYWAANLDYFNQYNPTRGPETCDPARWRLQLARNLDDARHTRALRLSMYRRDDPDGPMIGDCNLTNLERGAVQSCRLGYKLDQRHQGRGLMTEAVIAACAYAFDALDLHRVEANHMVGNDASASVLRRAGFLVEGRSPDYLFVGGAWRDHMRCALTNPNPRPPRLR